MAATRDPRTTSREQEHTGRKARVPLGRPRYRLSSSKHIPDGKVGRWINDDPGRLQAAEEGGWTYVDDPEVKIGEGAANERDQMSTKVRRRVGAREGGFLKNAYLMVIDKEIYDRDQAEKQKDIDRTEEGLRRGEVEGGLKPTDGKYDPREGIKINHDKVQRRSN